MTTTTSMTIGTTYDRYRGAQDLLAHRDPNAAYRVLAELLDEATADASRADDLGGAQLAAIRAELARAAYHSARLDITADLARESLADDPTDVDALVLLVRALQRLGRGADATMALNRLAAIVGPDHETEQAKSPIYGVTQA